jgi:hypothetical protein
MVLIGDGVYGDSVPAMPRRSAVGSIWWRRHHHGHRLDNGVDYQGTNPGKKTLMNNQLQENVRTTQTESPHHLTR